MKKWDLNHRGVEYCYLQSLGFKLAMTYWNQIHHDLEQKSLDTVVRKSPQPWERLSSPITTRKECRVKNMADWSHNVGLEHWGLQHWGLKHVAWINEADSTGFGNNEGGSSGSRYNGVGSTGSGSTGPWNKDGGHKNTKNWKKGDLEQQGLEQQYLRQWDLEQ